MISFAGRLVLPGALALLLVWRITGLWAGSEPLTLNPIRQPKPPVLKADLPSAMSFHWGRPLFARPQPEKPEPANPSAAAEESAGPPLRLAGIIADGENRVAVVALKGRLVRAQKGTAIGAWKVLGIESHSISIESRGETTILYLDRK